VINHLADVQHLEMFGRAVAINPTPALKFVATKQGLEIEIWQ
jgi:hypothetical protein